MSLGISEFFPGARQYEILQPWGKGLYKVQVNTESGQLDDSDKIYFLPPISHPLSFYFIFRYQY